MAICDKGHYYNHQQHPACPICGPGSRPAAAPQATRMGQSPAQPAPQPVQARPARTVLDQTKEAESPRLMGFLVVVDSRHEDHHHYFRLVRGVNAMGRFGSRARIELRDPEVSQEHALVICTVNSTYLIDLDSTNHVFINDDPVECGVLSAGDEVRVGQTRMIYVPFAFEAEE